ncbi:hypothetical protein R84B8_00570 [Treponema sp. R8-4-B8]
MNNNERGKPMLGLDKKYEFSKCLLVSISIMVGIVLIGTIIGSFYWEKPVDFATILPWTVSLYAIVTPYIKDK